MTDSGTPPAGQAVLPGMPTRLLPATPSRLTTWLRCPRRYRMTYLDRPAPPRGPAWAHSSAGAAAHSALARWWDAPPPARTPGRAAGLVAAAWADSPWQGAGFRDAGQSTRTRDRVAEQVAGYAATLDPDDEPRGVERTVALRTSRLALSGRVDRVDLRPGPDGDGAPELVVVDYKTGRAVPDTDDARGSLALAVYAAGAARTLRARSGLVELHHLPTGRVVRWRHTEAGLRRHLDRADDLAADIAAAVAAATDHAATDHAAADTAGTETPEGDTAGAGAAGGPGGPDPFPTRPGPACSWCDFRAVCPDGRRSSAALPPWAGLADEPDTAVPARAGIAVEPVANR